MNDGDLQVHDVGVSRSSSEQPVRLIEECVRVVDREKRGWVETTLPGFLTDSRIADGAGCVTVR